VKKGIFFILFPPGAARLLFGSFFKFKGARVTFLDRLKYTGKTVRAIFAAYREQSVADLDRWMDATFGGGGRSISGSIVDGETAHNFSAFFSGVFQISQSIGSCSCQVFDKLADAGKKPAFFNPVYNLLFRKANPYMNSFIWKEMMQHHAIVWGNGYSYIEKDGAYRPKALWPLYPDRMKVEINDKGKPEYIYRNPKTNSDHVYKWDEVFHLAGFGYDGLSGYSLLNLHKEAIGLGLSQQEFTERFISNGANISGIFIHPGRFKDEKAVENIKKSIREKYSGLRNSGRFMVLQENMDFKPLSMPLADAQFLESKVFQIQEIARILNIPPHKLKDMSNATYSNIEHQQIEYITDTIRPWAERWEAAIDTQLLSRDAQKGQKRTFAQFDLNQLIRGDTKTQADALKTLRYAGALNADEMREDLGRNPIENETVGEMYWMPVNMTDAANPVQPQTELTENDNEKKDEIEE